MIASFEINSSVYPLLSPKLTVALKGSMDFLATLILIIVNNIIRVILFHEYRWYSYSASDLYVLLALFDICIHVITQITQLSQLWETLKNQDFWSRLRPEKF